MRFSNPLIIISSSLCLQLISTPAFAAFKLGDSSYELRAGVAGDSYLKNVFKVQNIKKNASPYVSLGARQTLMQSEDQSINLELETTYMTAAHLFNFTPGVSYITDKTGSIINLYSYVGFTNISQSMRSAHNLTGVKAVLPYQFVGSVSGAFPLGGDTTKINGRVN